MEKRRKKTNFKCLPIAVIVSLIKISNTCPFQPITLKTLLLFPDLGSSMQINVGSAYTFKLNVKIRFKVMGFNLRAHIGSELNQGEGQKETLIWTWV